jgi:hypothetical protein
MKFSLQIKRMTTRRILRISTEKEPMIVLSRAVSPLEMRDGDNKSVMIFCVC